MRPFRSIRSRCPARPRATPARCFLIKPAGQIDRSLICDDPSIIEQIIASLSVKEMSQQALVRKLCTLSTHHRTRKAVFEVDKLVRSIYTLRYMLDPQLQRNVHRSQNRIATRRRSTC
ncbi:Tn3 family transposase [Paraburkholderia sp. RL18-103-BIB-C]|uniref:Tn3 family transposase n=1 Tax=unclassified Paraburkholderia TaxID=2615204 RepID=UPI0038BAEF7D